MVGLKGIGPLRNRWLSRQFSMRRPVREHRGIAQSRPLALAERDIAAIRSITRVNEENRGLRSGAPAPRYNCRR